jgi:hypothetical protein
VNRTTKGRFVKGESGNPLGRPKDPSIPPVYAPDLTAAGVELTKTKYPGSTRSTALLDRGYGRPAQSLDLHLSADAITKRLSDMSDAELAALEQRMLPPHRLCSRQLRKCRTM